MTNTGVHMGRLARVRRCLVLLCFALPFSAPSQTNSDSFSLSVMSFNIRFGTADDKEDRWELRKEILFDVIKRYAPDVVGVQEALHFQLDEIRKALPEYDEVGEGRDDGKTSGEYSAILFLKNRFTPVATETFWFSDTPTVPRSKSWGNSIPRICTWTKLKESSSGNTLRMYNLHLDHISQPSREKSVAALMNKLNTDHDPIIVTGDFNAGEQNPAIRFVKGDTLLFAAKNHRQLVDTYRQMHPADSNVGTFHAFKGVMIGEKIDYIFVEPGTHVQAASIIHDNVGGRYPSDHFPVVAKIVLPMNPQDRRE